MAREASPIAQAASTESATKQWHTLFTTCFRRRLRADQLTGAFGQLWRTEPIPGVRIAAIIFDSGAGAANTVDPLIASYLQQIMQITSMDMCDVLMALLSQSQYALKKSIDQITTNGHALDNSVLQESVFDLLVRVFTAPKQSKAAQESRRVARALAEWLTACNYHETVLQVQSEGLRAPETGAIAAFEALGTLVIAVFSDAQFRDDIPRAWSKDLRARLVAALSSFASLLGQWSPSQVAPRLQMIARTPPLTDGKLDFTMAEIASAVADLPISNSRVGLYVYLNAALNARPLTDDLSVLNYLHAKYQNDTQSLVVDMIVASFDVLANALQRHQPSHMILGYRSFIANKLPLLLLSLQASLYPPLTAQVCIQMAMGRVDVHPFPPLSSENEGVNEALKQSRLEFLQACLLHQLGTESAFGNAIGEVNSSINSRANRYNKDILSSQCMANVYRAEELVSELEGMQGNAGAISGALIETLQHFCATKETMSLRTLCNALSRRLNLMDVILQYAQPADIILPLCNMLNEWTHDEDQSEYQPPYEEFASLLLLVLAVLHRYDLSEAELGLAPQDNFVSRLLAHLSDSIPAKELTEEQNKHLSKWVQGLYATDEHGETNGISDETMSHCPPQAFYLLVPTLLEHSIQACKAGVLAMPTLEGGLEFLLEPFLLPSLVGGLHWLTKHSWEDSGDAGILLRVLQKLLRPSSISGDAKAMHETIIGMISRPLERSLQDLNRRAPNRKEVIALLDTLKPHLDSQRSARKSIAELSMWSSRSGGGLRRSLRDVISGLVTWSNQTGIGPMPTNYSHRLVTAAVEILGADQALTAIVDEVVAQVRTGSGSVALEITTALICAPESSHSSPVLQFDGNTTQPLTHRRTLRQVLRHRLENPKDLLEMETEHVETLIRLGRRVDAQSAVSSVDHLNMPVTNLNTTDMMQDINMTGTSMSADDVALQQSTDLHDSATTDFATAMGQSMDLSAPGVAELTSMNDSNEMSMDLSENLFATGQDLTFDLGGTSQPQDQSIASSFGGQPGNGSVQTTEEDIFAGLDMGDMGDDDFTFS